jgi:hypothetical protein
MSLRQIVRTIAGAAFGTDREGNLVANRRDGSQIVLDADATTGVPSVYTRTATGTEAQYQSLTLAQAAWVASSVSGASVTPLPYLTKSHWCFTDVTTGAFGSDYTQHVQMALEADFDAIQIGVANAYSAGTEVVQVIASVMTAAGDPSTTAPLNNAGTWVNAGVGGSAITIPAATVNQFGPAVAWGDVISLASVARSDGGALPLLCVRVQHALASNGGSAVRITSMLPGAVAGGWPFDTDNANSAPYGRLYRCRNNTVLGVTTPSLMSSVSNNVANAAPIIVRYWLRNGTGVTVTVLGDSIPGGFAQTTQSGWSFPHDMRRRVSTPTRPMELAMICMSGSTMTQQAQRMEAMAQHLAKSTALIPIGSPNSIGVPITAGNITADKLQFNRVRNAMLAQNMQPVVWTMLPAGFATKAWGSSDTLRIAMNAGFLAGVRVGAPVVDLAAAISGAVDGNGQVAPTAGLVESDLLHPSAAFAPVGGALLAAVFS